MQSIAGRVEPTFDWTLRVAQTGPGLGLNHPVADLTTERIKRRPVLGGLINDYQRAG